MVKRMESKWMWFSSGLHYLTLARQLLRKIKIFQQTSKLHSFQLNNSPCDTAVSGLENSNSRKKNQTRRFFFPFCCTFKWQCVEEREARIKRAWMHATHSQPESSRGESVTGRREVAKWVSSCFWFFGVFVLLLLREEVKTRLLQIPGRKPTAAWKFSPSLGIATTNENSKLSAALQFWGTETTLNSILLEIIVE